MQNRREYTSAEVGRNNGSDGSRVWIVLWGNVYDVADYMDNHPGGPELITEYAGMDATAGFDDFGHSSDAKRMLKKCEIGLLASDESAAKVNGKTDGNVKRRRKLLCAIVGPCVPRETNRGIG